ncbi:MAG: ubiquinone/menaquinone biosynthesis methyltransferase [Planctomycetes bacterium]|nr:ubiquinone/menaquinone biosynthesis methyltransferase [Planctomycetota bacterium]
MSTDPAWTDEALRSPHEVTDKAGRVRRMFDAIAPRYELVNTVFSGGRDRAWRRRAVELAVVRPEDDVLDVACGTGDFARAFGRANPRSVVGCDFAHGMLVRAKGRPTGPTACCEADALRLPFRDGSFSIASCAFGVRNFQNLGTGLREMFRVLRPGGRAVILEFSRPANPVARALYEFYAARLMPLAASLLSGDRSGAYRYLPRSVVSFRDVAQMRAELCNAGFADVTATALTMGIVTVYVATRV